LGELKEKFDENRFPTVGDYSAIIKNAMVPIGKLSEEPQESNDIFWKLKS
jgi:hypothetical protein